MRKYGKILLSIVGITVVLNLFAFCTDFCNFYTDYIYVYIANGYGKQPTNGYSIQVKNLYLTENAVCFKTELYGPQVGEDVSQAESFPYIVVKLEAIDLPVVFE